MVGVPVHHQSCHLERASTPAKTKKASPVVQVEEKSLTSSHLADGGDRMFARRLRPPTTITSRSQIFDHWACHVVDIPEPVHVLRVNLLPLLCSRRHSLCYLGVFMRTSVNGVEERRETVLPYFADVRNWLDLVWDISRNCELGQSNYGDPIQRDTQNIGTSRPFNVGTRSVRSHSVSPCRRPPSRWLRAKVLLRPRATPAHRAKLAVSYGRISFATQESASLSQ